MQLSQSMGMRMEQRQLLTPRMIQSMEILQLPLMALEERIEQELEVNPTLEVREGDPDHISVDLELLDNPNRSEGERVLKQTESGAEDFERLHRISEFLENAEFNTNAGSNFRGASSFDGERDKKLDAMNNTAARGGHLSQHLLDQWAFVETTPPLKRAGEVLINYVDADGYVKTHFDAIRSETKNPPTVQDLNRALQLVQNLDPPGVGARDLRECLALQLAALEDDEELSEGHDFELEYDLIEHHLKDLEMNRYPQLAKKLGRTIETIKSAVRRLARLHPHPGKLIAVDEAPPITPDAEVYLDDETGKYEIRMTHDPAPNLYVSAMYRKMIKDKGVERATRDFLANNARNAKWLIESIEQRRNTIYRVIRVVVDAQREFLDDGPEFLRPLPMISVADQLGIHVATVSRAVSEKWIQTPRGVYPLRRFFSGGTTSAEGEDMSWDAVKEKLKVIISEEDKTNPLNDDEIVDKLKEQGIELARRTVAKYRKILNIQTARQRRLF